MYESSKCPKRKRESKKKKKIPDPPTYSLPVGMVMWAKMELLQSISCLCTWAVFEESKGWGLLNLSLFCVATQLVSVDGLCQSRLK
jgi:hypothetical protein